MCKPDKYKTSFRDKNNFHNLYMFTPTEQRQLVNSLAEGVVQTRKHLSERFFIMHPSKSELIFKQRQASLLRLNLGGYAEYIISNRWLSRKGFLSQTKQGLKNICYCCGEAGVLWHHVDYSRLGSEIPYRDVVRVCDSCHKEIHKSESVEFRKITDELRMKLQPNRPAFLAHCSYYKIPADGMRLKKYKKRKKTNFRKKALKPVDHSGHKSEVNRYFWNRIKKT